jgi:hypothetical protein
MYLTSIRVCPKNTAARACFEHGKTSSRAFGMYSSATLGLVRLTSTEFVTTEHMLIKSSTLSQEPILLRAWWRGRMLVLTFHASTRASI